MRARFTGLPILLALASACSEITNPDPSAFGSIMVANASNGSVDVDVDRQRLVSGLSMNSTSYWLAARSGLRMVRVGAGNFFNGAIEVPVDVSADAPQTLVVYPTYPAGATPDIAAVVVPETGEFVPAGKSALRVLNLASTAGDVQIWRRQPGASPGSPIATPLSYRIASPWLAGDAGVWEVWLTASTGGGKLLSTGPIQVPSGERRSVLLVDTQEGPRFAVMGM